MPTVCSVSLTSFLPHCHPARLLSYCIGQTFFGRDFDENYSEMKKYAFQDTTINPLYLPLWLAISMCWIMDRWERLIHFMFNLIGWTRRTSHDVVSIDALKMGWFNVVVNSNKAQDVLGFSPRISKVETMEEARDHANKYWSSLVGPSQAFNAFSDSPRVSGRVKRH